MPVTEELCGRRSRLRASVGAPLKVDLFTGPAWPDRRQRRNDIHIGVSSARGIGVPAFSAACVEEKVMEVPKSQVVVALVASEALLAGGIPLEQNLAIHQQGEKIKSDASIPSTIGSDLLRRGQAGDCRHDLRIGNTNERA